MSHAGLLARLRQARKDQGLSQAALAARSGTSRITVARMEGGSGHDLRVGTLSRLCEALGVELTVEPKDALARMETRLLRERERGRRLDRRRGHAALAARLLAAPRPRANALVSKARAVVDRWERDRMCSRHYISRWRRMLAGPVSRVAESLLECSEWTDALLQNSPFALPGETDAG